MIYLDHAATTAVDKRVLEEMLPFFLEVFGNGSSQHSYGRKALRSCDEARAKVAKAIGAKPNEIYFTSGGTESDNWAIKGIAEAYESRGKHLITSAIEHPAVMKTFKWLEGKGFEVTYLPVNGEGFVAPSDLKKALRADTVLVSVMFANNEIGTIQPIAELAKITKEAGVFFHTDAVQAVGAIDIDVEKLGIDLLSLSGHKIYGPKGVGALYKRSGIRIGKFMSGGEQERNLRAGTLNTAGIVGMGKAVELACEEMTKNNAHIAKLRDSFCKKVNEKVPYIQFNGTRDMSKRLVSNASFSYEFIEGESLLLRLDLEGIATSSGSACSSGSLEPSYVLLATGLPIEIAHGTIRFSFGRENTQDEVDFVAEKLIKIVKQLREMSPLFKVDKGEKIYV